MAPSSGGFQGITTTDRTGTNGYNAAAGSSGDYTDTATSAFGGTSSATALAAGVAALLLSRNPNLSASDVRQTMRDTSDKIGSVPYSNGFNTHYGYGRINAAAALVAVPVPTVTLTVDQATIPEAGGVTTLTATVSATCRTPVTVDVGFTGSAVHPDDYTRSGTQIVIAPGETTGTITVTAVDDALPESNETVVVDIVSVTNAEEAGTQQQTITIIDDDLTAAVTGHVLNGGSANRSGVASLTFQLSEAATVDAVGSLIVQNHTTGATVDVSGATLVNNGTNAVTWNLAGIALPDGNYTATLPKTAAGLAATHTVPFHILAGDSSGNSQVEFSDFGDLANTFNTVNGPVFGPGDMDGNGDVNFTDFGILANGFNNLLTALTLDFGDAPESGTSFPTTLANDGARHVFGAGPSLGATVDTEADGQPDANAAGDGADEDGVTFATLTAGSNAAITVTATVPGTAVLNAWIDFSANGDWDDTGEKIISDQAVTSGTNNLTAAIPAGAVAGQAFARFRITTDAGHAYSGLARDGEVEDYQVVLVAAKGSSRRLAPAATFNLWAAAFVDELASPRTTSAGPHDDVGETVWKGVEPTKTGGHRLGDRGGSRDRPEVTSGSQRFFVARRGSC